MKTICPRVGEPCLEHECEFYDKVPATGEYKCRDEIRNGMLNDIAQFLSVIMKSQDTHRELTAQGMISSLKRTPTDELQRLLQVKEG